MTAHNQRLDAIAEAGKNAVDYGYIELLEYRYPGTKRRIKKDVEAVERWMNKLFYGKVVAG